jgi:hypothetical protein
MYSRSALVWVWGVVQNRMTHFRERCCSKMAVWGRVCTRRNRRIHVNSECVQWQQMGAVDSDKGRFARFGYPMARKFAWPCGTNFFVRRFLEDAWLYKNRPHTIQEPKRVVRDESSAANQELPSFWQFCESINTTSCKCRRPPSRRFPSWVLRN